METVNKTKKQNVLMVHNYYQIPGGEDTVVANEKQMLEEHGHKVILYSRHNNELKQMNKFQKLFLPITTIFNPRTYREIKQLIKQEKIDIVHVHNTLSLISPAVYYAARSMKTPVVQTVHNFRLLCPAATFYRDGHICEDCVKYGLKCAVKHNCYRGSKIQTLACVINTKIHRATGIYGKISYICLSEFNKNKLIELKEIKENQIYVKPNFTYQPETENEKGSFYLFIGRVEEIKGLDILLGAFAKLPQYQLCIAGTGNDLEKYKTMVRQKGIENVSFLGFLKDNELQKALEGAKAIIVTSQWYETFGMIIAEAYAAHKPVIVGNIGNIGMLVEEGLTGLKFEYNSVDALTNAIQQFEEMDTSEWGENAYKKYLAEFHPLNNYCVLDKIYNNIDN